MADSPSRATDRAQSTSCHTRSWPNTRSLLTGASSLWSPLPTRTTHNPLPSSRASLVNSASTAREVVPSQVVGTVWGRQIPGCSATDHTRRGGGTPVRRFLPDPLLSTTSRSRACRVSLLQPPAARVSCDIGHARTAALTSKRGQGAAVHALLPRARAASSPSSAARRASRRYIAIDCW